MEKIAVKKELTSFLLVISLQFSKMLSSSYKPILMKIETCVMDKKNERNNANELKCCNLDY